MTTCCCSPSSAPVTASMVTLSVGWRRLTAMPDGPFGDDGARLWHRVGRRCRVRLGISRWAGCCARTRSPSTMLIVIGVVGTLATWASIGYIDAELTHGHTDAAGPACTGRSPRRSWPRWSWRCAPTTSVSSWVAIEATTVITAFLVGHRRTRDRAGSDLEVRDRSAPSGSRSHSWAPCCCTSPPSMPARPPGRPWTSTCSPPTRTGWTRR